MDKPTLTYSASLARHVNLGNFESADCFECISGITIETTQDEIDALLDGPGALAHRAMAARLKDKCAKAKER